MGCENCKCKQPTVTDHKDFVSYLRKTLDSLEYNQNETGTQALSVFEIDHLHMAVDAYEELHAG